MNRFRRVFRSEKTPFRLLHPPANESASARRTIFTLSTARVLMSALIAAGLAGTAHAQGTMDFFGATTLMQSFKTLTAFLRRADEGTLSRLLVEVSILLAASRGNATSVLKDAAATYKVDIEAITTKVRQEFASKAKAMKQPQPATKESGISDPLWGRHIAVPHSCAKNPQGEHAPYSPCPSFRSTTGPIVQKVRQEFAAQRRPIQ